MILLHLSTADTARDLDLLRAAVGDTKLTYIGLSHGTHIGATYSSLFPNRVRAMVADGPVDPDLWVNRPQVALRELAVANEHGLERFFAACAAAKQRCDFSSADPEKAYDRLVASANRTPIPAPASATGTPVQGDDILSIVGELVIGKAQWPLIASALSQAQAGDASLFRDLLDSLSGRHADGTHAPSGAFFTTTYVDWQAPRSVGAYLREARHLASLVPHMFFFGMGYGDISYATSTVQGQDAFRGPWSQPKGAAPVLVIGVTHDARTPFEWAKRYTSQLGNARLLTYVADRHTGLTDFNTCLLGHAVAYVNDLTVPKSGAKCVQEYPAFPATFAAGAAKTADTSTWSLPPALGRRG